MAPYSVHTSPSPSRMRAVAALAAACGACAVVLAGGGLITVVDKPVVPLVPESRADSGGATRVVLRPAGPAFRHVLARMPAPGSQTVEAVIVGGTRGAAAIRDTTALVSSPV